MKETKVPASISRETPRVPATSSYKEARQPEVTVRIPNANASPPGSSSGLAGTRESS